MMRILDRLPIPQADSLAFVGSESISLKRYQLIVWISLTTERDVEWRPTTPRFPAIVDTGHTHNFSIQQQHLLRWAGIQPGALRRLGYIRHEGVRTPLHAARLWVHRNRPGLTTINADAPVPLEVVRGIAVHSDVDAYPRLPLLGLRVIVSNRLHVAVHGDHASVTVRSPDWRSRLLGWLA